METETVRVDLRVDLILRVQNDHMVSSCGTDSAPGGEHWRCKCGESYKGKGSIKKGRRHDASEVLAALDAAAVVA
jgi:hypothetical protein